MWFRQLSRSAAAILFAAGPALTALGAQIVYIPPGQAAADDGDAAADFRAGCRRLDSGDIPAAIELLSRAVREDPTAVEYQLKLSDAYLAGGRGDAAVKLLESAFDRDDEQFAVRTALARACHTSGQLERIETLLAPVEDRLEPELLIVLGKAISHDSTGKDKARALVRRAVERFPANLPLRLSLIDGMLERKRYAGALRAVAEAEQRCGRDKALHFRASRAYFELGRLLGDVEVRDVRKGREGQFSRRWLLVEKREGESSFLCCPEKSALYQLRRALDAGLDTTEAHLMHARIWREIGKPEVGFSIVKSREALFLEDPCTDELEALARLAFAADALDDFARYARIQARLDPMHSQRVIKSVFLKLAERFNQRGDGKMYANCLDRAARLDPNDIDLALRRAEASWNIGRRNAAAEHYRRVLELDPNHPQRRLIIERLGAEQSVRPDPG